jgi:acetyltransferase-like isoleucine patch superfamily enzyme
MSHVSHQPLLERLRGRNFHAWMQLLASLWPRLKSRFYYPLVFGSFGKNSVMYRPMLVRNPQFMHIGEGVIIRPGARLEAILVDPLRPPEVRVGNNVVLEQNVQIVTLGTIHIHDDAGIGGASALVGASHPFFDVHDPTPIAERFSGQGSYIEIGKGSLLGISVLVQMDVKIGKYVTVGANSVVKTSIPDYSVVNGNPAELVLKYDAEADRWTRPKKDLAETTENGSLIR